MRPSVSGHWQHGMRLESLELVNNQSLISCVCSTDGAAHGESWLAAWESADEVAQFGRGAVQRLHGELLTCADLDHEAVRVVEEHLIYNDAVLLDGVLLVFDGVVLQGLLHLLHGITLYSPPILQNGSLLHPHTKPPMIKWGEMHAAVKICCSYMYFCLNISRQYSGRYRTSKCDVWISSRYFDVTSLEILCRWWQVHTWKDRWSSRILITSFTGGNVSTSCFSACRRWMLIP